MNNCFSHPIAISLIMKIYSIMEHTYLLYLQNFIHQTIHQHKCFIWLAFIAFWCIKCIFSSCFIIIFFPFFTTTYFLITNIFSYKKYKNMHFMHQTANKALRHKALSLVYVLVHIVHKSN